MSSTQSRLKDAKEGPEKEQAVQGLIGQIEEITKKGQFINAVNQLGLKKVQLVPAHIIVSLPSP